MKKNIKYKFDKSIRLDKFLNDSISSFSRTKIQQYIKNGMIKVDDFHIKPSYLLKPNQFISINTKNIVSEEEYLLPQRIELDIIYEDDDIIVVNKEPGIVVHPGIGNKTGTLLNGLLYYCSNLSNINNRPGIIHRLDKDTSGLIVFAKTDFAHYFISEQFASRKIKKKYLAIIWGKIKNNMMITGHLSRDPKNRLKFRLFESKGKFSSSFVKLVSNNDIPINVVKVYPETGRTHQIRVHLSSIGNPILQDKLYGGGVKRINSFHQKYKINLDKIAKLIDRVALHASEIEFVHPTKKKKIKLTAPIPNDFNNVIDKMNEIAK